MNINPKHERSWNAPGYSNGPSISSPPWMELAEEAARDATRHMVSQGYSPGENATRDAAWRAANNERLIWEAEHGEWVH